MHVPRAFIVTVVPVTLHVFVVTEIYVIGRFDDTVAVGFTANVLFNTNGRALGFCVGNVIVCPAFAVVTVFVTRRADA